MLPTQYITDLEKQYEDGFAKRLINRSAGFDLDELNGVIDKALRHVDDPRQAMSPVTRLYYAYIWGLFEGWLKTAKLVNDNVDSGDITFENLKVYAHCRATYGYGVNESNMQYSTLLKECRIIITEARIRFMTFKTTSDADLVPKIRRYVLSLAQNGQLSTKKKLKPIFGLEEVRITVKTTLNSLDDRCPLYNLQTCCILVLILYTGLRISSICPPKRVLASGWKLLLWEDVSIIKPAQTKGHCSKLILKISVRHFKNAAFDAAPTTKYISCTETDDVYTSAPILFLALGAAQDVFVTNVGDWLQSESRQLNVKAECLKSPIFRTQNRNHNMSSTEPVASDSVGKSVKLLFIKAGLTKVGTLYALRRGFASKASTHLTREEATVLMDHQVDSRTLYENYVNCGGDLDLAQLIRENSGTRMANNMVSALLQPFQFRVKNTDSYKLTADERRSALKSDPTIEDDRRKLQDLKNQSESGSAMSEQDWALYQKTQRSYHSKRCLILSRATRDKLERVQASNEAQIMEASVNPVENQNEEELDEAVVTCFVDAVAEFGGIQTEAEAGADNDDDDDDEDEDEGTDSVFIHQVKSVVSFCNKANGRNPCVWCSEDDTITTSTTYEGTSMLMEHLLSSRLSHLSPDRNGATGNNGIHSEYAKFLRNNPPVTISNDVLRCPFCPISGTRTNIDAHLKRSHVHTHCPKEPTMEEIKSEIRLYFWENFGYAISTVCIEKMISHREQKAEKRRLKYRAEPSRRTRRRNVLGEINVNIDQ